MNAARACHRTKREGVVALLALAVGSMAACSGSTRQREVSYNPVQTASPPPGRGHAFPSSGAFGRDTAGGVGGAVLRVTSLNGDGPGSLREALTAPGPRVVVFEVGGIIDLELRGLEIAEPFVTVAGQTAPSPGITIVRGGLRVTSHDVVVEHVRFRLGDAGAEKGGGFEPEVTTSGGGAYRVVFNHLSVAWGVDENLSVSGPRLEGPEHTSHEVTIQNSIIAEGLRDSVHKKGPHSDGTLVHDYCINIAVVGNLYAHNDERNPWFKGFATGVIANNVIYNPGKWAVRLGPVDSEWAARGIVPEGPRVSIVGNYLRYGKDTQRGLNLVGTNSRGQAYLDDNIAADSAGSAVGIAAPGIELLREPPFWPSGFSARPAASIVDWVVSHAGARPKERDSVDRRIIADFLAGAGEIIDSQEQVGGYPSSADVARPLDVPETALEAWLAEFANEVE